MGAQAFSQGLEEKGCTPWCCPRGGGTTSITAKARPLVWRQREAELTPPGRLPLRTGEVAISIRVRPDSCYKRGDWWRASSSGATTITSGSVLTKEMSSWRITNAIDTNVETQLFNAAATKMKIQKRFFFSSTVYFSEVTWCENGPTSHLTPSCWNLINDYLKPCPLTAKKKKIILWTKSTIVPTFKGPIKYKIQCTSGV